MEKWELEDGVRFLNKIGLKKGQTVLDFGARVGHYSIPAALVTGKSGRIIAVDKEQGGLDVLDRKSRLLNLNNIHIMKTSGSVMLDLPAQSIDVVLLYDVLHYLDKMERGNLYRETRRVLRKQGLLSVYPKHVIEDSPYDHFRNLHWNDIEEEILDQSFEFQKKCVISSAMMIV